MGTPGGAEGRGAEAAAGTEVVERVEVAQDISQDWVSVSAAADAELAVEAVLESHPDTCWSGEGGSIKQNIDGDYVRESSRGWWTRMVGVHVGTRSGCRVVVMTGRV